MAKRVEETQGLILKSAKEEFIKNGFEKASLRTIAKNAGVTTGALYIRVPNKDALFSALVSDFADKWTRAFSAGNADGIEALENGRPQKMWDISEEVIDSLLNEIYENYDEFTLLMNSSVGSSYENYFQKIIEQVIVCKFLFTIISGTFSHIGAFNTLYNMRCDISRHIAKVNLGFFTGNTSGEIKKVVFEDVERVEKFLAHQIPDVTAAALVPIIVFIYMLTLSVPMALFILLPVVIGLIIEIVAMAKTGKQMPEYHRLLDKLNSTIMQFIDGKPVMKTFNL